VQDNTTPSSQLWLGRRNLHTTEQSHGHLQSIPLWNYKGFTQKMSRLDTLSSFRNT